MGARTDHPSSLFAKRPFDVPKCNSNLPIVNGNYVSLSPNSLPIYNYTQQVIVAISRWLIQIITFYLILILFLL